jgi:hypothetical protein
MHDKTDELWVADFSVADSTTGIFLLTQAFAKEFGDTNWHETMFSQIHGSIEKALWSNISYLE